MNKYRFFFIAAFTLAIATTVTAQSTAESGAFRAKQTGNWGEYTTWQIYDGASAWIDATSGQVPSSTTSVYIDDYVVTLTSNASCKNLNLSTTVTINATHIAIGSYTLSLYGCLRAYSGASPGTDALSPTSGNASWGTYSTGKILIVGSTRNATTAAQWAAGPANFPPIEVNVNSDQIISFLTSIKCANFTISSGTVSMGSGCDIRADKNSGTDLGNISVNSGCTLIFLGSSMITRTSSAAIGVLTIDGTLDYQGTVGTIDANTVNFNGTVKYSKTATQSLIKKTVAISSSATPSVYNNLYLAGSNIKTLSSAITVNGTLTLAGTSTTALALGSNTLSYGVNASLEYAEAGKVTTDVVFPAASGPLNLILNTTSAVTLHANRTINGTITRKTTSTFLSSSTGVISYGSNAILEYAGSNQITTTNYEFINPIPNLKINNSGGVMLNADRSVGGTLTLADGILTLGTYNLTATTISGGSSTAYVNASSSGKLIENVSATGGVSFPVGDGTNYTPTTVNIISANAFASATLGINVAASKYSGNNSTTNYIKRYWTLTQSGITNGIATIGYSYVAGDVVGSDLSTLGGVWNGSAWSAYSSPTSNVYTVTNVPLASSIILTGGETTALPVELTSFTGSVHQKQVVLNWNTATEKNNYGFAVERKFQDSDWEKVGFVAGNGTSNDQHSYSFTNTVQMAAKYSYRLKQMDNDGKFEYSKEIEAVVAFVASDYSLGQNYPNPFNPSTTFSFAVRMAQHVSLKVYNMVGQEICSLFEGMANADEMYTVKFDAKDLASGIYLSVLTTSDKREVRKMMLMK